MVIRSQRDRLTHGEPPLFASHESHPRPVGEALNESSSAAVGISHRLTVFRLVPSSAAMRLTSRRRAAERHPHIGIVDVCCEAALARAAAFGLVKTGAATDRGNVS